MRERKEKKEYSASLHKKKKRKEKAYGARSLNKCSAVR